LSSVFPDGTTEADLLRIYRPRPGLPFTTITLSNGQKVILWTTFTSEQIDLNVRHPQGEIYWKDIMRTFQANGIKTVRLDAVGYAIKKPGTSCFMIPETFAFIDELTQYARSLGLEVLVEIHAHYRKQIEIARQVDRVYDFALPPLVLHALYRGTSRYLKHWLEISPRNAVTVLDTHDGIGVIDVGPEVVDGVYTDGILPENELRELVKTIHERSNGESLKATGASARNLDLYQINCTFYDALGRRDGEYLLARALQFFAPGVPQVYYVGMLAGRNDLARLEKTGEGRDINRHTFSEDEVLQQLQLPVVKGLFRLMHFRNSHPAFNGNFHILNSTTVSALSLRWSAGQEWAQLDADFQSRTFQITYSQADTSNRLDSSILLET
jgi:sucrose phosphorylase